VLFADANSTIITSMKSSAEMIFGGSTTGSPGLFVKDGFRPLTASEMGKESSSMYVLQYEELDSICNSSYESICSRFTVVYSSHGAPFMH
jgi:hypothetical protein